MKENCGENLNLKKVKCTSTQENTLEMFSF